MVNKTHLLLLLLQISRIASSGDVAVVGDTNDDESDNSTKHNYFAEFSLGPQKNAQLLLDKYLLPHLRKYANLNGTSYFDLSSMRICRCFSQWGGCDGLTRGYLPTILERVFKDDREFAMSWHTSCVTDGQCLQMIHEGDDEVYYGCFDQDMVDVGLAESMGIQSQRCYNGTAPLEYFEHLWVCCNSTNYCANQTSLTHDMLPPPDPNKKRRKTKKPEEGHFEINWKWMIIMTAILFICNICCVGGPFAYSQRRKIASFWRSLGGDDEAEAQGSPQAPIHSEAVEMGGRVGVRTEETTLNSQELQSQSSVKKHPAMRLFADLESTMGTSGYGPAQLQPRSMKHSVQKGKIIGEGRFGAVFQGVYNNEDVAVKVFYAADEESYITEVKAYQIGSLRHPNVLRYIASERIDNGSMIEMWLLTEFHSLGSLYDFLQTHTLDIRTCVDMIRSTANGLAFLHHESSAGAQKPGVVHRDMKTRNILVKDDMTCAICDFGMAVCAPMNDEEEKVDNIKWREERENGKGFGTTRYLSPEILNGIVGPNRFEAFRVADVYSFTLCCWEIMVRTTDGDVVAVDPADSIPYGDRVGRDPSFDEMRQVVAIECARPRINPLWSTHPNFSKLYDLLRGSWVSAPSARLSAYMFRSRSEHLYAELMRSASVARQAAEKSQMDEKTQEKWAEAIRAEAARQIAKEQKTDEIPLLPQKNGQGVKVRSASVPRHVAEKLNTALLSQENLKTEEIRSASVPRQVAEQQNTDETPLLSQENVAGQQDNV